METSQIIKKELMFLGEKFEDTDKLFEFVGEKTKEKGFAKDSYTDALKERESNYPTGLQLEKMGVAIPHSDPEFLDEEFISLITLEEPVRFTSMEDPSKKVDVEVVFVLGLMKPEDQLTTLQEIMKIIQDKNIMETIKISTDVNEVLDTLKNV